MIMSRTVGFRLTRPAGESHAILVFGSGEQPCGQFVETIEICFTHDQTHTLVGLFGELSLDKCSREGMLTLKDVLMQVLAHEALIPITGEVPILAGGMESALREAGFMRRTTFFKQ